MVEYNNEFYKDMLKRKVIYGGKISEITYRNDGRTVVSQLRKAIDSIYYINASYFGTQRRSFLLLLINKILSAMEKSRFKLFNKMHSFLHKKIMKNKDSIEKYGFWGLVIFVGIPLPGTGAWTGAIIAAFLEMNRKKAFLAICLGMLMASIIMMIISFGVISNVV